MFDKLSKERVYGWGRSVYSNSYVHKADNLDSIKKLISYSKKNKNRIAIRAMGNSYGDNTLNDDQIILDITNFNKIINWNPDLGLITTEPGITIEEVLLNCVETGWVFPVMPGTRFVTLSGALANNVHGKNAFHQGYIGEHVKSFKVILSDNNTYVCSRNKNKELFYSVISGLGLIGVIVEITIQLRKVNSYYVIGKAQSCKNIYNLIEMFEKIKSDYEYSIAWTDAIKKNQGLGRGEINYANFLNDHDFKISDHKIPKNIFGIIPNNLVPHLAKYFLNNKTMKFINWLQVKTGNMSSDVQKNKISLSKYHYLMDMKFPKYNYFFKHGFFLYQPILPVENSIEGIEALLKITHKFGFFSVMSGIKAYRDQKEDFLLSFAQNGYSITMDIPKYPNKIKEQIKMFYEMNDCVIKYGGKIYLGKTSVLNKDHFFEMYKNLNSFQSIKEKYDEYNIFESNMYRRIMQINSTGIIMPSIYSI